MLGLIEIVWVVGLIIVLCVVLGYRLCYFYFKRRKLGLDFFFFVGDFLGEFINELDKGDWIMEFVCNGLKNYVY